MFHTSTAMPLLLYTNWPVRDIVKYLRKENRSKRGNLEELIPTERQEYESEVLQRDLTEAEVCPVEIGLHCDNFEIHPVCFIMDTSNFRLVGPL